MPNFDAGTYFLTVLAPVKLGAVPDSFTRRSNSWDERFRSAIEEDLPSQDKVDGYGAPESWRQRLRMVLATLPTAAQSPATERMKHESPFARNRQNHLARFVVIDDVVYNGRLGQKPFVKGSVDPLAPQHIDTLASPYLLFSADFDAVNSEGDPLPTVLSEAEQNAIRDIYLQRLWETAREEMQAIFENCQGFDDVSSAPQFAAYITACQVETTMPFHDYWIEPPALETMPLKRLALFAAVPLLVFAAGLAGWIGGSLINIFADPNWNLDTPFWMTIGGFAVSALVLFGIVKYVLRYGEAAFPPPKFGDLPSVLKSLYVQQNFAEFVADNQTADPKTLHAAFGAFLEKHQPENTDAPSQKPGYISSSVPGALRTQGG